MFIEDGIAAMTVTIQHGSQSKIAVAGTESRLLHPSNSDGVSGCTT